MDYSPDKIDRQREIAVFIAKVLICLALVGMAAIVISCAAPVGYYCIDPETGDWWPCNENGAISPERVLDE
jgi:hypothetical protein